MKQNKLKREKSPYLRSYADSPVNFYPWSYEAFEKALKEDKPIFLSIGYSSCHFCHVMKEESFYDEEVAKILNENFISILIDREERPDIDNFYMNLSFYLTNKGGWPLTIIMTPDKKPFFISTYIPKTQKFGLRGIIDILEEIIKLWKEKKEEIKTYADNIIKNFERQEKLLPIEIEIKKEEFNCIFDRLFLYYEENFDEINGGFGYSPKFPTPQNNYFLLRYYKVKGEKRALLMVEETLKNLRKGGIFDQIGFGFFRYSVDKEWKIPHFEKMLYDQALLILSYLETYQVTKNDFYLKTALEIFEFLEREMKHKDGAYFTSIDADSEGIEGKYYLWNYEELEKNLDKEEFDFIKKYFEINKEGNFENKIIFHSKKLIEEENQKTWKNIRKKLLKIREKRIRPFTDYKILTDWNSLLMISLLKLYKVTGEEKFLNSALNIYNFIKNNLIKNKKIFHENIEGETNLEGFLDDYSFFIWALIELYETIFDNKILEDIVYYTDYVIEKFLNKENYIFNFTETEKNDLPFENQSIFESSYPSGNSVMLSNLIKLYFITGEEKYYNFSNKALKTLFNFLKEAPYAFSFLLSNIFYFNENTQLVILGNVKDAIELNLEINKTFEPFTLLILKQKEDEIYKKIDEKTTYFLCKNFSCDLKTLDKNLILNKIIGV
ncbi:MAG: thioredoxin domain-containing protein [candidate division WOR-3 bacterium]